MRLLLGSLPFMVVAGIIEGIFSPLTLYWPWKLAMGMFTGVMMYSYLLLVGREPAERMSNSRGAADRIPAHH